MKGQVYKRISKSGHIAWRYVLWIGRDETGKRLRVTKTFAKKGDAEKALDAAKTKYGARPAVKEGPKTVREHVDDWLSGPAEAKCTPKTMERYRQLINYVVPFVGDVALRDLDTQALEHLYMRLLKSGGQGGRPLSARTVKHIADTVRCCLNTAIRWNRLLVNPAIACELPKIERTEAKIVEDGQLEFLVDAGRGHRWLRALLVVASATGLRRGELLALSWPDADLEYNSLTVSKSLEQTRAGLRIKKPKNGKTRRLPLPAVAVEVLRDHRRAQQEFRKAFGTDYRTDLDLVFCSPEGEYLKPNTVSPAVCLLAEKCGLKGIGLHSLRHTHGSQLLSVGVPLPTVSKRLGHSSVAVTAAIYAHSFGADELAAAEAWEEKLGAAIRGPEKAGRNLVAPFGTTRPS